MFLKGSLLFKNYFNQARVILVLGFRSIILSINLKRSSSFKEVDLIFFMRVGRGLRVTPLRAKRYSLQLAVFLFKQGWIPNIIQQRHTPREYISLTSLGMKFLVFNFQGGIQDMVPFLVVVEIYSSEIYDTPKSHNLKQGPLLRILAGFKSSWTIPAQSKKISPLVVWQKTSQISSQVKGTPNFSALQVARVPESQYS